MNVEKTKINNIPVTYVNVDKFRSTCGVLCFKMPLKRGMLEKRKLICSILMHTCKKYPTNKLLNLSCLENYDTSYSSYIRCDGNYLTNIFMFRCLDKKYSNKEALNKAIETFYELVFNPNVSDNKFDKEEYDLAYQTLKEGIETIKERPSEYANIKFNEQIGKNTSLSYSINIDDFNKITNENLYEEYQNMINNSEVSFFVAGNKVKENDFHILFDNLKSTTYKNEFLIKTDINYDFNEQIEDYKGMQSILKVAIKFKDLTEYERTYVVPIFNNILGSGASSRLFDVVREKNSLCYSCFSRYYKDCSLISITSGIDKENYEKTLKLIKEVIKSMKKITKIDIKNAKADITSALIESTDSLPNYTVPYYLSELYSEELTEEKIKIIKKVTNYEVMNLFDKVIITDSYFLRAGDMSE